MGCADLYDYPMSVAQVTYRELSEMKVGVVNCPNVGRGEGRCKACGEYDIYVPYAGWRESNIHFCMPDIPQEWFDYAETEGSIGKRLMQKDWVKDVFQIYCQYLTKIDGCYGRPLREGETPIYEWMLKRLKSWYRMLRDIENGVNGAYIRADHKRG
jgi:hypothetical protein